MRFHAAAKQVEAEIEVSRIVGVVAKERHGSTAQALGRRPGAHDRAADALSQSGKRDTKDLRIDRFFRIEMKIQRRRCVAGHGGYRAQRGAVQAVTLEYPAGGIEDQSSLELADGTPPAGVGLSGHVVSDIPLDGFSDGAHSNTVQIFDQ